MEEIWGVGGHERWDELIVGSESRKIDWQSPNARRNVRIGFLIGIGRFGHRAMKYENITSRPPT